MPTNTLTDTRCKSAKPAEKPYKLFDGGGLFLYISPTGSKLWRVAYRISGKPKTMSFGPYPVVSLAAARERREQLKQALLAGEDPMAPRKAARQGITLQEASASYWAGRKDITDNYRQNALRAVEMHLCPRLGSMNIGGITRDDLLSALQVMDAAGKHVYVRKVRMWASQIFDWAVENGLATINPAALIRSEKAFGKAEVESFAALELREVPGFLARLNLENNLQSVVACKLLAYTWVRTKELRQMEWRELDFATCTWTIPAAKMKRKRDHVVPLSRQAVALIKEMQGRCRGNRYVFECDRRADRPMSENAVLYLIHRIGYKGRMTGHGWRSIGSTWANENKWNPDAIERQLAHVPDNKIRAVYNRAEYLDERREMLQAWGDWLDATIPD